MAALGKDAQRVQGGTGATDAAGTRQISDRPPQTEARADGLLLG